MTEIEISKLYIRLAFYYESAIEALLAKGLIDADLATQRRSDSMIRWIKKKYAHPKKSGTITKLYAYT